MKIEFDYRFDTNNFFGSPGSPQRQALEKAGEIWASKLQDDFETIPAGLEFELQNPQTGIYETITLEREIDDLLIFVGASATPFEAEDIGKTGTRLDGTENLSAPNIEAKNHESGCCCNVCGQNIHDLSRGAVLGDRYNQPESLGILAKAKYDGVNLDNVADVFQRRISDNFRETGTIATDFEPWVGVISFSMNPPQDREWDFSLEAENLDPQKYDFVSVATHEIGHTLGIGTSPAFDAIGEGASFDGVNTLAQNNNQPVLLESDLGHVQDKFNDDQILLDPVLNQGRNLPSAIDFAMLADIGYEIAGFSKQGSQPALATENAENIFGASFNDDLNGLAGNDLIIGNQGDDLLLGGTGDDTIVGDKVNNENTNTAESYHDSIFGNDGNDSLLGGTGNDTIDGGLKNDEIFGQEGNDSLLGGEGKDTLNGGIGDDILRGHDGDDELFGGEGVDTLWGLNGNDTLQGNAGADILNGGLGADILIAQDGNDELNGGDGNDSLWGELGADRLYGDRGDDYLIGGVDSDTIEGGEGNDTLFGEAGADRFVFNLNSGKDLLEDFIVGEDLIEVSSDYGFADGNAVLDATEVIATYTNGFDSRVQLDEHNFIDIFHDQPLTSADFTVNFPLQVATVDPTSSGFTVQFNEAIDLDLLNLDDLSVVKKSTGEKITGSIVGHQSGRTLTFVPTEGILASGDYQLTLVSGDRGLVGTDGEILDCDRDGNAGGDFITDFTISQSEHPILSIDDFSRQLDNNPNNLLQVSLDNGEGVTQVDFTLSYNPDILNITDVIANADGWQVASKNLNTPGQAIISLTGTTPLPSDKVNLVSLETAIPDNADSTYGTADLLEFKAIDLNGGNIDAIGDRGIAHNLYQGDTDGDSILTNSDAALISYLAVGIDNSLAAFDSLDPHLIADVNADGVISAFDSFLVANQDVI